MKFEKTFKITFEYDELSTKYGIDIPLKDFNTFCKIFTQYFPLEAEATAQWIYQEWDELKEEYDDETE